MISAAALALGHWVDDGHFRGQRDSPAAQGKRKRPQKDRAKIKAARKQRNRT
jgi:hypothetical protein